MFITALGCQWTGQRKFINIITAQHKYFSLSTKLATYVKAILWIHINSLLAPVMYTSCKILHIYHIHASFKSFYGCWCIHAKHEKEKDGSWVRQHCCVFVVWCKLTWQALFHLDYLQIHTLQLCMLEIHNKRIGKMFLIFFHILLKKNNKIDKVK